MAVHRLESLFGAVDRVARDRRGDLNEIPCWHRSQEAKRIDGATGQPLAQ
jgi:hypothetical protein